MDPPSPPLAPNTRICFPAVLSNVKRGGEGMESDESDQNRSSDRIWIYTLIYNTHYEVEIIDNRWKKSYRIGGSM